MLRYLHNIIKTKIYLVIPLIMGLGFIYKYIFGSNNEKQIRKVFWHETRLIHGILYMVSTYYFYNNYINIGSIILFLDILFSIFYRFFHKI
jgi:hypothetical protein